MKNLPQPSQEGVVVVGGPKVDEKLSCVYYTAMGIVYSSSSCCCVSSK